MNQVAFSPEFLNQNSTAAVSAFPLGWPWEAQSSPLVARDSWGLRSSHCRAEETRGSSMWVGGLYSCTLAGPGPRSLAADQSVSRVRTGRLHPPRKLLSPRHGGR